jgi:hypothetical protein
MTAADLFFVPGILREVKDEFCMNEGKKLPKIPDPRDHQ